MKKKKALGLSLAVVLIAVLLIGGTLSYFTDDDEVLNKLELGDLKVDIDEPEWEPEDGENMQPGDTFIKDPVVTALKNDMYFRIVMSVHELEDGGVVGDLIDDEDILELIFQTLYLDKEYPDEDPLDPKTKLKAGTGYTLTQLATLLSDGDIYEVASLENPIPYQNPNFSYVDGKGEDGEFYYNYVGTSPTKSGAAQGVLYQDESVYFMSHIIIPTDWTQATALAVGNFAINFRVEAVQTKGFNSVEAAMAALDIEIAAQQTQQP